MFFILCMFFIFKNIYNILTWPMTCLFVNLFFHQIANKPTKSFCLCPTSVFGLFQYMSTSVIPVILRFVAYSRF